MVCFDDWRTVFCAFLVLLRKSLLYQEDSEISSISSFADLELMAAPLEPADEESDWLYRIIFNPSEKVPDADEIMVSFHSKYVQIDTEFYLTTEGVEFESILEWAESKFDYFMG